MVIPDCSPSFRAPSLKPDRLATSRYSLRLPFCHSISSFLPQQVLDHLYPCRLSSPLHLAEPDRLFALIHRYDIEFLRRPAPPASDLRKIERHIDKLPPVIGDEELSHHLFKGHPTKPSRFCSIN
jgi:hypothetical protein